MTTVKEIYSADEIAGRIDALADEIVAKVSGNLTVIGVLKGSFVFLADLVRALDSKGLPCHVEFLRLSSYGNKQKASGDVVLIGDYPEVDDDRTVLLVDDIVDTGNSLNYAVKLLHASGREKIMTCTLLDKPSRREADIEVDFVGFTIPDEFVVGYGIDFAEDYRSLPYLGVVEKEEGQEFIQDADAVKIQFAETEEEIEKCKALRRIVFIEEQNVSQKLEVDGLDSDCAHVLATSGSVSVATARIKYQGCTAKIQRVCVLKHLRGKGVGAQLMKFILSELVRDKNVSTAQLGAQIQALQFYENLGFSPVGEEYLDAGIPHQNMEIKL